MHSDVSPALLRLSGPSLASRFQTPCITVLLPLHASFCARFVVVTHFIVPIINLVDVFQLNGAWLVTGLILVDALQVSGAWLEIRLTRSMSCNSMVRDL